MGCGDVQRGFPLLGSGVNLPAQLKDIGVRPELWGNLVQVGVSLDVVAEF